MREGKMWGGRFTAAPGEILWRYTVATDDRRLLADDVAGSIAHVRMLGETGILEPGETDALVAGLERIAGEAASGAFIFADGDEDVHSAVERRLHEIVGDSAGKLHTGRSRNDQVALDLRLYLRRETAAILAGLEAMVDSLVAKAEEAGDTVVAAYTHLQQAQAVPLAHHLLAYAWMLLRDAGRFVDATRRSEVSPLGAGAGGGTSLPLDPAAVAAGLGMSGAFENSLDAVGSRDAAAEFVFCCAQAMVHLSRLAEELILWSTVEFGWASFDDAVTTGSSALPQKKNPDIAELARGRAAIVSADLAGLLALQKGLPLAYNRDLQEDKTLVFHAADTLAGTLEAMTAMVASATLHPPLPSPWVAALDLAEVLVERGVPFRQAHEAVGAVVAALLREGRDPASLSLADLHAAHGGFEPGDEELLDPLVSVRRRRSPGGGSFDSVAEQLAALRERSRHG